MFSLFSKVPAAAPTPNGPTTPTDTHLKRTATVNTVTSGIKAEQERSDILQEQIVILSEKTAQAYDKVAETEAENKRLAERVKSLEALLKEKQSNKSKAGNDELIELKLTNTALTDKLNSETNESMKLRRKLKSLQKSHDTLQTAYSNLKEENRKLISRNKSLEAESATVREENLELSRKLDAMENSDIVGHERESSLSSFSSGSSTMFSYSRGSRNSSTDEVDHLVMETSQAKLEAQLQQERQKRHALMASFKQYQEKTSILADFNTGYIKQLNERIEELKVNEDRLKMKVEIYQRNVSMMRSIS